MSTRPGSGRGGPGGIGRPPTGSNRGGVVPPPTGPRQRLNTGLGGPGAGQTGGMAIPERNVYAVQIRNKITEINQETDRLEQDMENRQNDGPKVQQLTKRIEDQSKELNQLHDQLTDVSSVNEMAQQRVHIGGMTAQDVDAFLRKKRENTALLSTRNQRAREAIDDIFSKRNGLEKEMEEMEEVIKKKQSQYDDIIRRLNPQKQQEYRDLQATKERLEEERVAGQQQLETLQARLKKVETEMLNDPSKKRVFTQKAQLEGLKKRFLELNQRQEDLEGQLETSALTVQITDDRDTILQKVKENKNKIAELEKSTAAFDQSINQLRKEILVVGNEENEKNAAEENEKKLQELQEKEQELDTMIDAFEPTKADEEEKLSTTQETILALLQHISRGLQSQSAIITPQQVDQLAHDLDFKTEQTKAAVNTNQKLSQDLSKLKNDLAKVNDSEKTIRNELDRLVVEGKQCIEDVRKYSNIEALRDKFRETQDFLSKEDVRVTNRLSTLKKVVEAMVSDNNTLQNELEKEKVFIQLQTFEKRIQHYFKQTFDLQQSIISAERESNYAALNEQCMGIVDQINLQLIKAATASPQSVTISDALVTSSSEQTFS